ncbi:MAG: GGDEF domain-containing protein [Bacillota bacterium]|nr:GGDEF domain-containing protein [Bacillota bacterium]
MAETKGLLLEALEGVPPAAVAAYFCRLVTEGWGWDWVQIHLWDGRRWVLRAQQGERRQEVPFERAVEVWAVKARVLGPGDVALDASADASLVAALKWVAAAESFLQAQRQPASLWDPATGLWSQGPFARRLEEEVARSLRLRQPLALVLLSLGEERFEKEGWEEGVGQILGSSIRLGDVAAREGRRRFALLLPGADAAGAERVAARVVQRLQGTVPKSPISAGVADIPADAQDAGSLRAAAEKALYLAEMAGGAVRAAGES